MKREQEVLVLADELEDQGNVDENTRALIIRGLGGGRIVGKHTGQEEATRRREMWKELEE